MIRLEPLIKALRDRHIDARRKSDAVAPVIFVDEGVIPYIARQSSGRVTSGLSVW